MSNLSGRQKASLAETAASYAALGWKIFPLSPRSKKPFADSAGFRDATDNQATIAAWWAKTPNANIGLATGEASGVFVVDPDGADGLAEWAAMVGQASLQTATVRTPGGGKHFYFRFKQGMRNRNLAPHVHSRGDGGYVVLPPSIHPNGGTYEWELTPESAGIMELPEFLAPTNSLAGKVDNVQPFEPADPFKRCRAYLETIPDAVSGQGGHAVTFRAASECFRFGLAESQAWDMLHWFNLSKCQPAWSDKELRHKLQSAKSAVDREGRFGEKLKDDLQRQGQQIRRIVFADEGEEKFAMPAQAKAFPPDLLNPPGVVGEICRWMNATAYKPQPILSLANTLAFFGAVVGRKIATPTDLRTNMYCLGVGESGCGKDHSRKCVKRICDAAGLTGDLLGGEELASDSAILSAVKSHPSILFQLDEIGHMLSQANSKYAAAHMRNIAPTFMRLFSSANTVMIGKEYIGRDRADIDQPNACLYGTTVPGRLFGGLSPSEISDGFLGRMLVFISDNADPDEEERPTGEVPDSIRICVDEWFKRIDMPTPQARWSKEWKYEPIIVPFSADATASIARFAAEAKSNKAACRDGSGTDALWARSVEHVRKISAVVAAGCDFKNPSVDAGISAWSVKLVRHLTASLVEAVRDNITDSEYGRMVQKIKTAIAAGGARGITGKELTIKCQGIHKNARRDAVDDLLTSGQIILAVEKTKTKERRIYIDSRFSNSSSNSSCLDFSPNSISSN